MSLTVNRVTRCLRCSGALRLYRRSDFPDICHGQIMCENTAVWCDKCGIIYDDHGITRFEGHQYGTVVILRILPKDICRACGGPGVLKNSSFGEGYICSKCNANYYYDEYGWFLTARYDWINSIENKIIMWDDDGKPFRKVDGW